MNKNSILLTIILTVLCSVLSVKSQANFGANGIHDPSSIVKLDGVYHIFGTGNQITHLVSTDLVSWTPAPSVFATGSYPSWIATYVPGFTGNFWAPEIVNVNGVFYLYYACSTGGNVAAIGLATSTDLITWVDKGVVTNSTSSSNFSAVDPSMFVDATGSWWLTFGSHFTGIYIAQLDPVTGKLINTTTTNIAGSSNSEHAASYVNYNNGYYYLFYNVGICCNSVTSTSVIKVGRSANPTGPYIDKNGALLKEGDGGTTVLSTSGKYIGPGQLGLFKENGRNIATIHYYDRTSAGVPKLDQARLTYDADGWPVISRDILSNARYRIKNRNSGLAWQAQGCTGVAGQKLVQATPSLTDLCQQWELTSVGDGFYKLKNLKTGANEQVIDLPFCASDNGTLLGTWDWLNNDCQKFKIEQTSDGSYVFSTVGNPNRVIEVPVCSTASGTQLALLDYNGLSCQKWVIEVVNTPDAPVTRSATNITANAFTANWAAVPGATSYQLDVSSNPNFSSFITGYNNLSVSGTSYAVTSLFANAGYFYRVRAVKEGEFSLNSNVTSVYTAGNVDNGMHDPSSITKEGNTYYSYGTGYSNSDGSVVPFTISSTNDLFKWTRGSKPVFATGTWPAWINTLVPNFAGIFWAPEIIFLNGKYHLYYSVSAFGSSTSAIGLATTPTLDQNSPDYKWTDHGMVVSSNAATQANAIDAAVLKDDNGRLWLSYGSFSAGLVVVELDPTTGLKKAGATTTTVAGGNRSAWEAPYILKEGNYYYLFANRQYCCALLNSTYYLVVGRATNITGPYVDKNGTPLTVTSSGTVVGTPVLESAGKFVGPGHIGLLKDNGRNIISTHYYDATSNGYPRIDISTLKFTADGWPIITRDVLPEGRYTITNKNSNLAWETAGCTGSGGQQLVQSTPDPNALCQQWDLTPVGEGYYRLKNANGGNNTQVVDAPFCNTSAGTLLGTWDWLNNDCQKYKIDKLANGSFVFSPYLNGAVVIEVPGASTAPNAQLGFWPFNENAAQLWSIDSARFAPVATNSTSITASSFQAKWAPVPNATSYKVDVYTAANTAPVAASTVAGWNFEAGNNMANTGVAANIGKLLITGGGTSAVNYNYAGNAGLTAMATGWNAGNLVKYWEASNISTKGYYSLKVSSKQRSNSTAPRHFKLQYKIGITGAYADVPGSYVTNADNYTSGTLSSVQLPSICDNQPSVYLRWLMITNTSVANNTNANAGGIGSGGQSNIDDIVITGSNSPSYTFVAGYEDTTVSETSLTVSGLSSNTEYFYRVRSYVSGLTSKNSNVVSIKTLCDTVIVNAAIVNATCNGSDNGSIALSLSGGSSPYSVNWTGPDAYTSTDWEINSLKASNYTVSITQSNSCITDTSFTITEPTALVADITNSNPQLYYGYTGDQTSTIKVTPTGGTAPYKVAITMNRPLKCNEVNDYGDEKWVGNVGTSSNENLSCPVNPSLATSAPVSTANSVAPGSSYSVTVTLMANADITTTVTDANGCVTTSTTHIEAQDARCFPGNSSISKISICHRTGNSKNPRVKLCVNESEVNEHLAHGDYLGSCTPDGTSPSAPITTAKVAMPEAEDITKSPKLKVYPNPSLGRFTLTLNNLKAGKTQIEVMDVRGVRVETSSIEAFKGQQNIDFNYKRLPSGMYMIKVVTKDGVHSVPLMIVH